MLLIFVLGENSYFVGFLFVILEKFREYQCIGMIFSDQQFVVFDYMKGKIDFNDLVNKSVLGKEGIDCQVWVVVYDVIEKY